MVRYCLVYACMQEVGVKGFNFLCRCLTNYKVNIHSDSVYPLESNCLCWWQEMLLLLLPLLNSSSVRNFLRPFSKEKSTNSAEDDSACPICLASPTIAFLALPCQHRSGVFMNHSISKPKKFYTSYKEKQNDKSRCLCSEDIGYWNES